jgi:uncharacterized membrane-anchored protein YhcB (DUF1043 family)
MNSSSNGSKPAGGGVLQKLPKFSTSVWLIIIAALVLVVVVPMVTTYLDETTKQGPLKDSLSKLQSQYTDLQKQLSSQSAVTAQINALKADADAARTLYGNSCDSIDTSRDLIDLAWQYDITMVNMGVSSTPIKIQGKDYPGTTYVLAMSGQVANFQNYLIAVGKKFASSQAADVVIQPALLEGALDHATLTITILCPQ